MCDMQRNFNFTLNFADCLICNQMVLSNNEIWVLCPYLIVEQKLCVKFKFSIVKKKVKSLLMSQKTHQAGAYPWFP